MEDVLPAASEQPSGTRAGSHERGLLVEYAITPRPLVLPFLFNPSSITRTRSLTVRTGGSPGARGGYAFASPDQTPRASQGATASPESLTFRILLDATDRMNDAQTLARELGVQPEIDVIRAMLEPRPQTGQGLRDLRAASAAAPPAFATHEVPTVLLFKWGLQMLPVFMTQAQIEATQFLPTTLFPYRAEATLTLQVIETDNPVYGLEQRRKEESARTFASLAGLPEGILKF